MLTSKIGNLYGKLWDVTEKFLYPDEFGTIYQTKSQVYLPTVINRNEYNDNNMIS